MNEVVRAQGLSKTFKIPVANERRGFFAKLKHFVMNPSQERTAVDRVSFTVESGEIIGFLGANGSGKSTTIKMLSGILTPTAGELDVLGYSPHRQRKAYTRNIGVVFGQRSLLWWNIPVLESFKLYRDIYGQSDKDFEARLDRFAEVLEIRDFLHVPVRKLSLGMRMRAEIAASLLHKPKIIFLDEPTIGLDVLGRRNLKVFLKRINEEEGTTIFLTTHNMFDVEDLCRRCIILEGGKKIYEGDISALKAAERFKTLELEVLEVLARDRFEAVLRRCEVLSEEAPKYRLRVPSEAAVDVIRELFGCCRLSNLNILPPSLEGVVEKIFEAEHGREENLVEPLCEVAV